MAKKMRLRIVTPNRIMFDDEVEMVVMRGREGDFGILAGHAPLATILAYGTARIKIDENTEREAAILGGFVRAANNLVTILSDDAEWPEEIDIRRAEDSKIRAERRLHETNSAVDVRRAELALRRSLVRIEVSTYPLLNRNAGNK